MHATRDPPLSDPNRSGRPETAAKLTPLIAQYIEIKSVNPDCLLFYRLGDFYELFFGDAEIASRALGIVLTKRGKHMGRDIPMCGVPVERADDYLARLIALGHRVAVCEQIEDPAEARKRGGQSLVKRDVVRLVTPGTITEENLLDPARANCLVAVVRQRRSETQSVYGIASLDISTGAFSVSEVDDAGLGAELARIEAAEVVAPEALCADQSFARLLGEMHLPFTLVGREMSDPAAERRLIEYFGIATLDGLGAFSRAEIAAAALAICYVERTQCGALPALSPPTRTRLDRHMEIDAPTRVNLELTRTLAGGREGSLLAAIDATVTPGGGRLLAARLAAPLTDADEIGRRLDAVGFLREEKSLRSGLRTQLAAAPDLLRPLSRLALQRSGPRDLAALRDGISAGAALAAEFGARTDLPADLAASIRQAGSVDPAVAAALAEALAAELPLKAREGNFVRPGFDAQLDTTRALRDESRRVVAELQSRYCELAQSRQLKIKHNNFLGFFIEAPQAQGERLLKPPFNSTFLHRQTMAGAMRFSTAELAELEAKIASAAESALARELEIFDRLGARVLGAERAIKAAAEGLASLDVAAALAELADTRGWTRPEIDASLNFAVEAGRHPVVEAALAKSGKPFVANDCHLSGEDAARIAVLTGPNMAGKSTYLRQNALISVLAQMGSFVPAAHCEIGIVDRLFSRVGAADDLARGRSTFMVEMVETAAILNQATQRSLVILDEIGRGTATFDGLAIAWAVIEYLHEKNRPRTLFATHFHELTHLAKRLRHIVNLTIRVADWKGELVFLHEIVKGSADKSYGIQVAKLAGLPSAVVERAQKLLAEFEAADRQKPVERLVTDLPLFASVPLDPPRPSKLTAALDGIDPDGLTPRQALDVLYKLQAIRREDN